MCDTQEDYLHLVKVLSTRLCKSCRSSATNCPEDKWTVTESIRQRVRDTVTELMTKCSTYSKELDSELGLLVKTG